MECHKGLVHVAHVANWLKIKVTSLEPPQKGHV